MVLVLFEVTIKNDCMEDYLEMASNLKDDLTKAKGFIRSERFSSLVNEPADNRRTNRAFI